MSHFRLQVSYALMAMLAVGDKPAFGDHALKCTCFKRGVRGER